MGELLVFIETEKNGILSHSYDLITGAFEISLDKNVSGVIVLHPEFNLDENIKNRLKACGLSRLYTLRSNAPFYDKRLEPYLIAELIKNINPEIFILTSTAAGREIAPVVATILDTGLTADCTKIEIKKENDKNKLVSTRPTFGGKLAASIICKKNPQMATVRGGSFKEHKVENTAEFKIIEFNFGSLKNFKSEILNFKEDNAEENLNLQNAKIILAGGLGLKNKENFDKLKLLAKKINAVPGASRKAVDRGFIEKKYQIGQTGSFVTPDIYIAFGISGAIHHITGMENSKKIIAINTDKNAPVFNHADIGLVKDAASVLDELLKEYA